jgi:2-hydroxychromene-2-carboxylate isomerase
MKHLTFWLDPISPYAYLAFEQLPQVLQGLSVEVEYRPVLFAGLLKHWGQKGPAEIGPKRDWTYRQVAWLAERHGVALQMPAAHPFNPLPLLRLAWACAPEGRAPGRYVCETVLRHVWQGGAAADGADRLQALRTQLAPALDADDGAVKQRLREATDDAIARGVFGVPTIDVDGHRFWGFDALPMLRACLDGDPWFDSASARDAATARPGVQRS